MNTQPKAELIKPENFSFGDFEFADKIQNIKEVTLDKVSDDIKPLKAVYDVADKVNAAAKQALGSQ